MTIQKMLTQKRAISPLVATVLLIAFAVALGAIVMNWGKGYIETQAETTETQGGIQTDCARYIDLNIVKISGERQICYNESTGSENDTGILKYVLRNDGTLDIPGFKIQVIGENGAENIDAWNESIPSGGVLSSKGMDNASLYTYNKTIVGNVTQITFKPYIDVAGQSENVVCPKGELSVDNVDTCS